MKTKSPAWSSLSPICMMICTILHATPALAGAEASGAGNGGNFLELEFVVVGRTIVRTLNSWDAETLPEIDPSVLERAVEETRVEVSKNPLLLQDKEVDAKNFPEQKRIVFNENRWQKLETSFDRMALVLHEYLGIIGIERGHYAVSSKFMNLLQEKSSPTVMAAEITRSTSATIPVSSGPVRSGPEGMRFKVIPPTVFMMGSRKSEYGRREDEVRHEVILTRPYEIQTTEVTQLQWFRVMGSNPSAYREERFCPTTYMQVGHENEEDKQLCPHYPVEEMSVVETEEFLRRLNAMDETYTYRLPTEAEWEAAARCGTDTVYFFGDDPKLLGQYAWHGYNSNFQTHAVATRKPNPCGLYDMYGNVWERIQDWYIDNRTSLPSVVDPVGPSAGLVKVIRGGSWYEWEAWKLRSAGHRGRSNANSGGDNMIGLRLVRTLKTGR